MALEQRTAGQCPLSHERALFVTSVEGQRTENRSQRSDWRKVAKSEVQRGFVERRLEVNETTSFFWAQCKAMCDLNV